MGRLRSFSTTDGMGMVILGAASVVRGVSYLPALRGSAGNAHYAEAWLPMTAWAWVWIIVGTLAVAASARWSSPIAATAVGLSIGLHALWASSLILSAIIGEMGRGYVSAISYLAIALLALWAFARGRRDDQRVVVRRQ